MFAVRKKRREKFAPFRNSGTKNRRPIENSGVELMGLLLLLLDGLSIIITEKLFSVKFHTSFSTDRVRNEG